MHRVAATCLLIALTISAHAAGTAPPLEAAIESIRSQVVEWRRDIHRNPELSNREVRTAGLVATHLQLLGLEVRTGIAHTGVVGILRGGRPGPVIALRADMDALPVTEQTDLPYKSVATSEFRGETVGVGYEPELFGHLEYDRQAGTFTRFDLIALGDYYGRLGGSAWNVYRPGRQPLGITFELSSGDTPADRIPR